LESYALRFICERRLLLKSIQVYRKRITGTTPIITTPHQLLSTDRAQLLLDGDGDVPVPLPDGDVRVDIGVLVVAVLVAEGLWLNTLAKTAGGWVPGS